MYFRDTFLLQCTKPLERLKGTLAGVSSLRSHLQDSSLVFPSLALVSAGGAFAPLASLSFVLALGAVLWFYDLSKTPESSRLLSFDLVLIDKYFKAVGLRELVRPFRVTWPERHAESVLELPAHTIFRSRTQIGDQLLIERYEAKKSLKKPNGEAYDFEPIPIGVAQAAGAQVLPISPQTSRPDSAHSRFANTKTR